MQAIKHIWSFIGIDVIKPHDTTTLNQAGFKMYLILQRFINVVGQTQSKTLFGECGDTISNNIDLLHSHQDQLLI